MSQLINRAWSIESRVLRELRRRGYDEGELDLIEDEFMYLLTDAIRDGDTRWPVATGTSRDSFFARDGYELWNSTDYAAHVEGKGNYIQKYLATAIRGLVEDALALVGLPGGKKGAEPFGLLSAFALGRSLLQRIR